MPTRARSLVAVPIAWLLAAALPAAELSGHKIVAKPFEFMTDVGQTQAEQKATAAKFLKPITETANFFLKVYELKPTCFEDYAAFYDRPDQRFEKLIRVRLWKDYDAFLTDFQERYKSKAIPGAFFGVQQEMDQYGKPTGNLIREIGTSTAGEDDMRVLRHLYHEMGHLFMRTYIVRQVEVPSWIEEGTAELFQFRKGNGTKPEAERDQRVGWLREAIEEGSTIPWKEMINVKNIDNLDFTYQDPMRSRIQYMQAWSMIEFMVSNQLRQSAFIDMLRRFKAQAESRAAELSGQVANSEEFLRRYQPYLYEIQEATFKKCYGNDILAIEGMWKDWVRKMYDTDVKKRPILRYHRGEWWLTRAQRPRKGETPAQLHANAARLFEDCIAQAPESPEGYVGRGRLALAAGDLKKAGPDFTKALELGAESYDALLYAGMAHVMGGRAKDAIAPLTKAAEQRPTDATCQRFLGQALGAGGGDYQKAITALRAARDIDKESAPECAFIEGAVHYLNGKLSDAYISWLRAGNLRADFPLIQVYQALAKAEDNQREEAIELLKPIAGTPVGKAFTDVIADSAKPLPKVSLTPDGWPTIDFAAAGLTVTRPGQAQAEAPGERAKDGAPKGEAPKDEAGKAGDAASPDQLFPPEDEKPKPLLIPLPSARCGCGAH